jgi:hypothetical protein
MPSRGQRLASLEGFAQCTISSRLRGEQVSVRPTVSRVRLAGTRHSARHTWLRTRLSFRPRLWAVRDDPIGLRGCVEHATALSELGSNHRTVERGSR